MSCIILHCPASCIILHPALSCMVTPAWSSIMLVHPAPAAAAVEAAACCLLILLCTPPAADLAPPSDSHSSSCYLAAAPHPEPISSLFCCCCSCLMMSSTTWYVRNKSSHQDLSIGLSRQITPANSHFPAKSLPHKCSKYATCKWPPATTHSIAPASAIRQYQYQKILPIIDRSSTSRPPNK